MNQALLSIDKIDSFYGEIQALHGVSLDVRENQIVALLGANGAGKSTTLKTISGLVQAKNGNITLDGANITREKPHSIARRRVVHVPEGRRILKTMSIKENLELGGFALGSREERQKRLKYVFELFPVLGERRSQDASLLSGGEQQMLAIGRAYMANPRILLLDEPSMGLAPVLVTETMQIISRLNQESGTTILLVEQNARLALKLADYGYVLENGEIKLHGKASELQQDDTIIKTYMGMGA